MEQHRTSGIFMASVLRSHDLGKGAFKYFSGKIEKAAS